MIGIIAALAKNRVIGLKNVIPWKLPADLVWFKKHTVHKTVIMGRITWESIGFPLQERNNIVISRRQCTMDNRVKWVKSINEATAVCKNIEEIMVIGGGEIYKQFLPRANKLYLTHVDIKIKGDTYFPVYNLNEWKVIFTEYHNADKCNPYNFYFEILKRCY